MCTIKELFMAVYGDGELLFDAENVYLKRRVLSTDILDKPRLPRTIKDKYFWRLHMLMDVVFLFFGTSR